MKIKLSKNREEFIDINLAWFRGITAIMLNLDFRQGYGTGTGRVIASVSISNWLQCLLFLAN